MLDAVINSLSTNHACLKTLLLAIGLVRSVLFACLCKVIFLMKPLVGEPDKSSYHFLHVIANSVSLSIGAPFGANGGLRN